MADMHRQHSEDAVGILCQATIAHLGRVPQTLQGQERVLGLGSYTGPALIRFLVGLGQRMVLVGAFVGGEVLRLWRNLLDPLTLLPAPVGTISIEAGFLAVQQVRHLVVVQMRIPIMDVGRSDTRAMNQASAAIRANVRFYAKAPLVALSDLMHFLNSFLERIATLLLVLGRRRDSDQRGIHKCVARELFESVSRHSIGQQQLADRGEQHRVQRVFFEQVAKVEQGCGVRYPLPSQIKPAELAEHGNIVENVFAAFVAQVEPVGPHSTFAASAPCPPAAVRSQPSGPETDSNNAVRSRRRTPPTASGFPCASETRRLARRSVVFLASSCRCQRHLLHRLVPCDRYFSSDSMTVKSFTAFDTYSVFP